MARSDAGPRWSDHAVDQFIGRVLQVGVMLSAAVVIVGAVMLLAVDAGEPADFAVFMGQPDELRSVQGILGGVLDLNPRAILQLGLVLLVATPVARVALTFVAFVIQRDRLYTAMTGVVLALLLYGLIWGRA